jgi:hypothetical protein
VHAANKGTLAAANQRHAQLTIQGTIGHRELSTRYDVDRPRRNVVPDGQRLSDKALAPFSVGNFRDQQSVV